MNYSELLNEEQLNAVTCSSQYTKVIAGAGSGKTRVLTYRISYLMSEMNVLPSQILGITFTNKAAKEIKDRVMKICPNCFNMALCTIHSWCARFLRQFADYISYPRSFTILDEDDQLNVMKNIFVSHGANKKDPQIKECLNWISSKKNEGLQYKAIEGTKYPNPVYNKFLGYYGEYTEMLQKQACLDFDDLLLKTIEILEDYQNVRELFQKRITHILVDEFQDINDIQFYLIRLLMCENTSLYVVGDPDQTIYTWRGANSKIMLDLEKNLQADYKKAEVNTIILKNNYRSSKNILKCANALIDFNKERIKKDLFAINPDGEEVTFFNSRTIGEEASYIAMTIKDLIKENKMTYNKFAVLYRSNYLTRELESQLNLHQIPYKLFGGQKFYQRREIKDVIAYLYLLTNPLDSQSLERIINVPSRNIGPTSVELLKKEAEEAGQSLYLYLKENLVNVKLPEKKKLSIQQLISILEGVKLSLESSTNDEYGNIIEKMLNDLGYFKYLSDDEDNGEERVENVKELIGTIKAFFISNTNSEFSDFILNASLQASSDEVENGDYVSLMTVHTAKGLEFDTVFIYGFNDGVFPSQRAIEDSRNGIEEERRLAYVAITRAKKKLYITCNQDFSHVQGSILKPSRFLSEAGIKVKKPLFEETRYRSNYMNSFNNSFYQKKEKTKTAPPLNQTNGVSSWNVNDMVEHEQFGVGVVIKVVSDKLIEVKFNNPTYGIKTLLSTHYKIKKLVS